MDDYGNFKVRFYFRKQASIGPSIFCFDIATFFNEGLGLKKVYLLLVIGQVVA
jgi:hypothetical protein